MRRLVLSLALVALFAGSAAADPPRSAAAEEADRAAHTAALAGQRLLRLLDEARVSGHRDRTSCVDGKLAQVNSFTRMILDRRERLRDAEARRDDAEAAHHRAVLRNLSAQMQRLEREGRACVFPEVGGSGTTVVTLIDRDVPDEDPSLLTEEDRRRWLSRRRPR